MDPGARPMQSAAHARLHAAGPADVLQWMESGELRAYVSGPGHGGGGATGIAKCADRLCGHQLGPEHMIKTAHDLGIAEDLPDQLSISLGAGDTTLLELSSAYQVFAAGGVAHPAYALESVVDGEGHLVYQHEPAARRMITPAVAYLITGALREVMKFGTAASSKALGVDFAAAGKTGTTEDYRDAYFMGYTPTWFVGSGWDSIRRATSGLPERRLRCRPGLRS